jgi:predicted flap endonuclease-1-like 5' DNA nuclease
LLAFLYIVVRWVLGGREEHGHGDATVHKAELTGPPAGSGVKGPAAIAAKAPSPAEELPKVEFKEPSLGVELPKVEAEVPGVSVELPWIETVVPSLGGELPKVEVEVPSLGVDLPGAEGAVPVSSGEPLKAETAAPFSPTGPDDLKIVEGIGPKISSILHAAGIHTFAQLAVTEVEHIKHVLEQANPNLLRLADPTTWPEQARLAADGQWEALKELQDRLKGGRQG